MFPFSLRMLTTYTIIYSTFKNKTIVDDGFSLISDSPGLGSLQAAKKGKFLLRGHGLKQVGHLPWDDIVPERDGEKCFKEANLPENNSYVRLPEHVQKPEQKHLRHVLYVCMYVKPNAQQGENLSESLPGKISADTQW